jgi:hypothetical protein
MSVTDPLPGLPGAGHPGTGPVVDPLLDDLLTDAVPFVPTGPDDNAEGGAGKPDPEAARAVGRALAEHRDHRRAWYGDLVGSIRVPASATSSFVAALQSGDHRLPIVLTPDPTSKDPVGDLRAARYLLLDNHRVELTGVELPFSVAPAGAYHGDPGPARAEAARKALDELDFSVAAWFMAPAVPGWEPAFDVLAQDGAESVALFLPPPQSPAVVAGVAGVVRYLIDRELPFAAAGGVHGLATNERGYGLLNVLGTVRAALNGADADELAAILAFPAGAAEGGIEPLAAAARRMSEADAATVRAFLPAIGCPSIRDLIEALQSEGLIAPEAA